MMKNWSVRKKFLTTFGIVVVLFLASVLTASLCIVRAKKSYQTFFENSYQAFLQMDEVRMDAQEAGRALAMAVAASDVSDIENYYNAGDLLLLPSQYEGLPLTMIEAQVSGLPCVVSSAIPDEALMNNNIIKCHTWNENEWLKAIEKVYLLHTDRKDAFITIQQAGYDLKIEADKLASKYKQLVRNRI